MMKRFSYILVLSLIVCTLCACGGSGDSADPEAGAESSGNFSSEMMIEPSTDVTIIEVP